MHQGERSILQYFRPSLSYHMSLRPLFCLFLIDRFTQVLLYYVIYYIMSRMSVAIYSDKNNLRGQKKQNNFEILTCDPLKCVPNQPN